MCIDVSSSYCFYWSTGRRKANTASPKTASWSTHPLPRLDGEHKQRAPTLNTEEFFRKQQGCPERRMATWKKTVTTEIRTITTGSQWRINWTFYSLFLISQQPYNVGRWYYTIFRDEENEYRNNCARDFPSRQVVKTVPSTVEGEGLTPDWGTKISHAAKKVKKQRQC